MSAETDTGKAAPLWFSDAFLDGLNGLCDGSHHDVHGLSIDTRSLNKGDAYFAIQGDRFDGHAFAAQALDKGAAAVVVASNKANTLDLPQGKGMIVRVDEPLAALNRLAHAARARSKATIVAITGSVGKTSTKAALAELFENSGKTHASVKSFNNHWGVPLSVARMPQDVDYAVFEIGMNHADEIRPLVKIVRPHIALITMIAPVHLEFLGSIEAIADAKAEIFEGLEPNGTAIIPGDLEQSDRLAMRAREAGVSNLLRFGEQEGNDTRLLKCILRPENSVADVSVMGEHMTYKTGAPGKHLVMNSLGLLTILNVAGCDLAQAGLSLAQIGQGEGRGRLTTLHVSTGEAHLMDDSFNANPASVVSALEVISQYPRDKAARKLVVLTDMLELGADAPAMHADLAGPIADNGIDLVYCAGPDMKALWDALPAEKAWLLCTRRRWACRPCAGGCHR